MSTYYIECNCGNNCNNYPIGIRTKDFVSAAKAAPHLLAEWSPKNGCLTLDKIPAGNNKVKLIWQCKACGNEWSALIANRVRLGSGCPECGKKRLPQNQKGYIVSRATGTSIAELYPNFVQYWDNDNNDELTLFMFGTGSERSFSWICDRNHSSKGEIGVKLQSWLKTGTITCAECANINRSIPKAGESLGDLLPHIATQWHPTLNGELTPYDVKPHADQYAYWLCESGHITYALIRSRTLGHACGECRNNSKSKVEQAFRELSQTQEWIKNVEPTQATLDVAWGKQSHAKVDIFGLSKNKQLPIVIEYDGEKWHKTGDASYREVIKTNALLEAGYLVIRVREHQLESINIKHSNLYEVWHDFGHGPKQRKAEYIQLTLNKIEEWVSTKDY